MRHSVEDNGNRLICHLASGGTALCLPIRISRSAHIVHMAHTAGFHAVYIDMEQSNISLDAVSELCAAAWGAGITALVRVPTLDDYFIRHVLDGGAAGVIVPHVNTPAEAKSAVDAALFAPYGSRSTAGAGLAQRYGAKSATDVARRLNNSTLVVVMLESREAIDNADSIAAIEGVDMLFVGTGDLSRELGIHGEHNHPLIREAYDTAAAACRHHDKWLGVAGIKGKAAAQILADLHRLGARFLSAQTEESLLLGAIRDESNALQQIFTS
jgi:2-keto-3-deoxy-L-rhamnonate aldolase RhmA